jgi:hypothetical protein
VIVKWLEILLKKHSFAPIEAGLRSANSIGPVMYGGLAAAAALAVGVLVQTSDRGGVETAADVQIGPAIGSGVSTDNVAWELTVGQPAVDPSLPDCVVMRVGTASKQLCLPVAGSPSLWMMSVGGHQVLIGRIDPTADHSAGGEPGVKTPSQVLLENPPSLVTGVSNAPEMTPVIALSGGWYAAVGADGGDGWPERMPCLNRAALEYLDSVVSDMAGAWSTLCRADRGWTVARSKPGQDPKSVEGNIPTFIEGGSLIPGPVVDD